jgi:hypothetical protein
MKTAILSLLVMAAMAVPSLAAETQTAISFFDNPLEYWRHHILLANVSHAAGGFGLALVLQRYLAGKPTMKVLGWLLLAFTLVTHFIAFS